MAERRPPGFNVDLGFYDSPEVLSIPRKHRAAAVGVWTLCGAYSAKQLTDGHVSAEKLKELGCTPAIRDVLMATNPDPLWVDGDHPGAIRFTRWAKWQRTSAEIKAYRSAEAARAKRARDARKRRMSDNLAPDDAHAFNNLAPDDASMHMETIDAHAPDDMTSKRSTSANRKTSGRTSGGRSHSVRPEHRDPKTETETETETSTSLTLVEGGPGGDPARRETAARGSRLPDEWIPNPEVVAQMRSDHPHIDLKAEHAKFVDYWHGRAGKDARKTDWNATWRNWIRRASEQSPHGRAHAPPNGIGKPSLKALGYQALADEIIAEMEHE